MLYVITTDNRKLKNRGSAVRSSTLLSMNGPKDTLGYRPETDGQALGTAQT
jgi:hypothetical protein